MTDPPSWRAGALIYSGRPDPSWSVTAEEAAAWLTAFNRLTLTRSPIPSQSRLGYRGAWLQAPDGRRWNAFLGVAWLQRDRVEDVGRALERKLLTLAPRDVLPNNWDSLLR
jgi:hypothetical protein